MPASRRWFLRAVPASVLLAGRAAEASTTFQIRGTPLFVKEDGRLKRVLSATLPDQNNHSGVIELSAGGGTTQIRLDTARRSGSRVLLPVDPPEQETVYECVYRKGGRSVETRTRVLPERHWRVYIVHNSHQDLGYEGLPSEMRAEFIKVIDEAVRCCEQTRNRAEEARFKWNIETSCFVEDYRRARGEDATRKLMDLIKSGTMEVGAFYTSVEADLLTVEPLHRLVHYATASLAKEFTIPVQSALLGDVPGFPWGLADVMARSGVRYFLFSGNTIRSNLFLDAVPILFYWEGPAGGRVLLWRSTRYDEGMHLTSRGGNQVDLSEPDALAAPLLDRYSRGDYPYDAILLHTANDFIHPYLELSDHVERWNRDWEYPRFRMATMSEFFRYIEKRYPTRIPVLRGGFPDAWNDLRGSLARESALARRIENELPEAEKWATVAAVAGLSTGEAAELTAAYHNLLTFEEHTLGWEAGKHDTYLDESEGGGRKHHQEKVAPLMEATATTRRVKTASLAALARNIKAGRSRRLVVWNSLSWARSGLVRLPLPAHQSFILRDAVSGAVVPYQILTGESASPELAFVAGDVPGTGYRCFEIEGGGAPIVAEEIQTQELELENRFYRARIEGRSGAIASLLDKDTGQELLDQRAPHQLNQLIYVLSRQISHRRFDDLAEMRPGAVRISQAARGAVCTSLKARGAIEYMLQSEQEVILYSDLKRVDLVTRLSKKPLYAKEGLYLTFPFQISATRKYGKLQVPVWIDVPGGFMRPEVDQLRGSSFDYYVAQHGVRLEDRHKAVFWTSLDAPVVRFGGIQSNRWNTSLSADQDALAHPWIYSFLLNNHWYTNTPIAQGGQFTFRYSFTSQAPGWDLAQAKRFGWETLCPLEAMEAVPGDGTWPESGSLAAVEPANAALAGVKIADDGNGVILRLIEVAGLETKASVHLSIPSRKLREAALCDTREDRLAGLLVSGEQIEIRLAPYEMATVRVLLS